MAGSYHLEGVAVPDSLDRVHDLLERVRAEHPRLAEEDVMMFETAIAEIHGNVIAHGRPKGQVLYSFDLEVQPDRLTGLLVDNGLIAPNLAALSQGVEDDMAESGRGMWLAAAVLDDLEFEREGDRNTWRMVKLRS